MKRSTISMFMLLTLALPAAGFCADAAKPAGSHAAAGGSTPAAEKKAAPAEEVNVNPSGVVVETLSAGNYTYAKLRQGTKDTWVAYTAQKTRTGDKLIFKGCTVMNNFESKTLNRTFETVLFCDAPQASAGKGKTAAKPAVGPGGKVEKAEGANAYTVADIFAKRAALNKKQVVVRGKVVKVSTGIMKKNWLHLQDGTGSEKNKTNDLVVTTEGMAKEGDVVTVSGKVAKDRDFGSGYKYKVIIENATLQ